MALDQEQKDALARRLQQDEELARAYAEQLVHEGQSGDGLERARLASQQLGR